MGETEGTPTAGRRSLPTRMMVGFGRFWWEFLIGETPELFVGAVCVIGVVALICVDHRLRTAAAFVLPLSVTSVLAVSVWRASRRRSP